MREREAGDKGMDDFYLAKKSRYRNSFDYGSYLMWVAFSIDLFSCRYPVEMCAPPDGLPKSRSFEFYQLFDLLQKASSQRNGIVPNMDFFGIKGSDLFVIDGV